MKNEVNHKEKSLGQQVVDTLHQLTGEYKQLIQQRQQLFKVLETARYTLSASSQEEVNKLEEHYTVADQKVQLQLQKIVRETAALKNQVDAALGHVNQKQDK